MRWRAGAWRVQVYAGKRDDGGPQFEYRTVHAPNTAAGRRKAEQSARDLYDSIQKRDAAPGTFADLVERWIEHRAHEWAPRAASETRSILNRRVLDHLGAIPVDRLTPADLDACYARLRRQGLAPGTVRRTHIMVHAALEQAVMWGHIERSPADRVRTPRYDPPEAALLPPPETIRGAMTAALADSPMLAVIIRLGLHTGARRGELVELRWNDLDLDDMAMRIWQTKTRTPKFLAIGARTAVGLTYWRTMVDDIHRSIRGGPMPADWWLFPSPRKPDQHLGASAVSHGWDRLGIDVPFKTLRKTMSTVLLGKGYDIRTVMGRGGWSAASAAPGAAVMLTHYAQFVNEVDRRAAETLDDWLDG